MTPTNGRPAAAHTPAGAPAGTGPAAAEDRKSVV